MLGKIVRNIVRNVGILDNNVKIIAAERQRGSTLFLTLHEVLAFSCPVPGRVIYSRNLDFAVEMSANPGEN